MFFQGPSSRSIPVIPKNGVLRNLTPKLKYCSTYLLLPAIFERVVEPEKFCLSVRKDVSGCTALETLNCSYNQLTELDVSHNTKLTILECYGQKNGKGWIVLKLTQLQYDKHKSDNGNDWFAPEDVVVDSKV